MFLVFRFVSDLVEQLRREMTSILPLSAKRKLMKLISPRMEQVKNFQDNHYAILKLGELKLTKVVVMN